MESHAYKRLAAFLAWNSLDATTETTGGRMTQNELIIAALKRGPLTSIGIIQAGGTVNPTARLSEIRRLVNIEDEWVSQGNRRYKRYRIVQE